MGFRFSGSGIRVSAFWAQCALLIFGCCSFESAEDPRNHYHYYDNRVLPPHVDVDMAYAEGPWLCRADEPQK